MSTPTNNAPAKVNPNALAGNVADLKSFLEARKGSIKAAAASMVNPERLLKVVLNNVTKTPALKKCSIESVFRSTLAAAELGLEPGGALGLAYLVPYKDTCQLIVGYRGLIDLACRAGHVSSIRANVVYQGDVFEFVDGLDMRLRHVPAPEGNREPTLITYVYCVVRTKDGGAFYDVMTRGEVDRIRSRSKSGNAGPWVTDYAEMARKTVTRRCLKYVPMSIELRRAIAMDDAMEGHDETGQTADWLDLDDVAELPADDAQTTALLESLPPVEGEEEQGQGTLTE